MNRATVLVLLMLLSCKPFARVKSIGNDTTLFDRLIARAPQQRVPYPFSALLSHLSQYGKPVGVLMPLGRSLQRQAASFVDPRRVVGFDELEHEPHNKGVPEFDLRGRLFLGYVENTAQVEIMSLLPGRNEFAFQTVENYGTAQMQMQSHSRTVCGSCHQHGGPLFTPLAWEETNEAPGIAFLLQRRHPHGNIDNIPIIVEHEQGKVSPAQQLEELVLVADNITNTQHLWRACGNATCRVQVLRKTFAQIDLALPLPATVNTPSHLSTAAIIPDRNIIGGVGFNLFIMLAERGHANMLADYQLSPAAQNIFTKIKKAPPDEDSMAVLNEPDAATLVQESMIAIFSEAVHLKHNEQFTHTRPTLSAAELDTVYHELEQMLLHVQRKDLHRNSHLDPQQPRETRTPVDTFDAILDRETDKIFRQQLLLPENKKLAQEEPQLEKIELHAYPSGLLGGTIFWRSSLLSSLEGQLENTKVACRGNQCQVSKFTTELLHLRGDAVVEKSVAVKEFNFVVNAIGTAKPTPSALTLSIDNKTYTYHLLCRLDEREFGNMYLCSVHNLWQMTAAITRLRQKKDSPLHADTFNPVAVIKALLAELGHDLTTYTSNINWYEHTSHASARRHELLHHDVRKILLRHRLGLSLLKRCSGCHDSHAVPAPFLVATSITQLCNNLSTARATIIARLDAKNGRGDMPPANTPQHENFGNRERQALVTALRNNKLAFCP